MTPDPDDPPHDAGEAFEGNLVHVRGLQAQQRVLNHPVSPLDQLNLVKLFQSLGKGYIVGTRNHTIFVHFKYSLYINDTRRIQVD